MFNLHINYFKLFSVLFFEKLIQTYFETHICCLQRQWRIVEFKY